MKKVNIDLGEIYKPYLVKYLSLKEGQKKRVENSAYLILSLFTVSFFGFFAINPTLSTIAERRRQYEDSTRVENALREKLAALDSLAQQYTQITSVLPLVESAIPTSFKVAEVTAKLRSLAFTHRVQIGSLSYGALSLYEKNPTTTGVSPLHFSMMVTGGESEVNGFFSDIINFDRVIALDSFTIEKQSEQAWVLALSGNIFFKKE